MKEKHYECCFICGGRTGRAGRGDDSLYIDVGKSELGPLCEECHNALCRDDLLEQGAAPDSGEGMPEEPRALTLQECGDIHAVHRHADRWQAYAISLREIVRKP